MATYGFLGLGIMGSAMAANLVKAGFDVTVWNRSPEKCEPLVALGAKPGESPRAVAASLRHHLCHARRPRRGPCGLLRSRGGAGRHR